MDFDFVAFKEAKNLQPIEVPDKERYYLDLMNIEQGWIGRADALYANEFFQEAVQLIVNSIVLFEKGYFDCAYYSLRQSLEISTTIVYFVDNDDADVRKDEITKWKSLQRFPMHNQMHRELERRQNVFANMKDEMKNYFDNLEHVKQMLNKYVHKQGLDKFYVARALSSKKEQDTSEMLKSFVQYLDKSIGAIAVYRLSIDPLPVLLMEEDIYRRTGQFMTGAFNEDFVAKYIGEQHIASYKKTELYKGNYDHFIKQEEMLPSVVDVVKNDYISRDRIEEIISQVHLLSYHERGAVAIVHINPKVAKVYCINGWHTYLTELRSKRTLMKWGSDDFEFAKQGKDLFNKPYDEAFLSAIKLWNEFFYLEHNEILTPDEIAQLHLLEETTNEQYLNFEKEINEVVKGYQFG